MSADFRMWVKFACLETRKATPKTDYPLFDDHSRLELLSPVAVGWLLLEWTRGNS